MALAPMEYEGTNYEDKSITFTSGQTGGGEYSNFTQVGKTTGFAIIYDADIWSFSEEAELTLCASRNDNYNCVIRYRTYNHSVPLSANKTLKVRRYYID